MDRAAPGTTLVLIGLNPYQLPLTTDDMLRRQLVLRGSMIYDHPGAFTTAIAELPAARPGAVIEADFPLERGAPAGVRRRRRTRWKDLDQHQEWP